MNFSGFLRKPKLKNNKPASCGLNNWMRQSICHWMKNCPTFCVHSRYVNRLTWLIEDECILVVTVDLKNRNSGSRQP